MKSNRKIIIAVSEIILIITAAVFLFTFKKKAAYIHNSGQVQGTYYSAVYLQPEGRNLQPEIDSLFLAIDSSLSVYNPHSTISRINRNDTSVNTDALFEQMFFAAQQISEATHGAFDITVAPLVNAWGFGFGSHERQNQPNVDSLRAFTGYKTVKYENRKIVKGHPSAMLDASAIAQGLTADLAGQLLEKYGCENYLFDIGGEIVCKGMNEKGAKWRIAIDKPVDDSQVTNREYQAVISITDAALTTSGNYRQFYYRGGKKISHTINPLTGFPVNHNLLSATVIAPDCTQADAFATAFMVMGADSALAFCRRMPEIECYLVLADSTENFKIEMSEKFMQYLK